MRISFLSFLFLLLFSCGTAEQEVAPENILPVDRMAAVLTDVQLLEASMNLSLGNAKQMVTGKFSLRDDVLARHQVSREQYDQSFAYYAARPQELTLVYQEVLNTLSRMQAEVLNSK